MCTPTAFKKLVPLPTLSDPGNWLPRADVLPLVLPEIEGDGGQQISRERKINSKGKNASWYRTGHPDARRHIKQVLQAAGPKKMVFILDQKKKILGQL